MLLEQPVSLGQSVAIRFESERGSSVEAAGHGAAADPRHANRTVRWTILDGARVFQCQGALLRQEGDHPFLAVATQLPGVVSEGMTEEAAILGLSEALGLAISSYLDECGQVPWSHEGSDVVEPDDSVIRYFSTTVDA